MVEFVNGSTVNLVRALASDDYIIQAAQVSVKGENEPNMSEERRRGFINHMVSQRHGSCFEHTYFSFSVQTPLVVVQEMLRHRVGTSFNQESGRYKVMDGVFYIAPPGRKIAQEGRPGHYKYVEGTEEQYKALVREGEAAAREDWERYHRLLDKGISRELARMYLPHNLMTSLYFTVNARSLMNFLSLRVESEDSTFVSHPMWEIQDVAEQMEAQFAEYMPLTHEAFVKNGRVAP